MKYLLLLLLILIQSCICNKSTPSSPEDLKAYADSLRASQNPVDTVPTIVMEETVTTGHTQTHFFTENGSTFYKRDLSFTFPASFEKGATFTVQGSNCEIRYEVITEPVITDSYVKFSAYTDYAQWFSSSAIQRAIVIVSYKDGEVTKIKLNGRTFFVEVPAPSNTSYTYEVRPGDTAHEIARKKGVRVSCLSKTVNLRAGEKIVIKCE